MRWLLAGLLCVLSSVALAQPAGQLGPGQVWGNPTAVPAPAQPMTITAGGASPPQGRLTLTSNTPVMITRVVGATLVFYTSAAGNVIPIYDGTNMVPTQFNQLINSTQCAAKNCVAPNPVGDGGPAAVTPNGNYDLYVWLDGATLRLTRSPRWTSDTLRATSTFDPVLVKGIHVNAVNITNGPAAQRGTYVGTVRSSGGSTINFETGVAGNPPTGSVIGIWNRYNQVQASPVFNDTKVSWTYNVVNVPAPLDGSLQNRMSWINGLGDTSQLFIFAVDNQTGAVANHNCLAGISVNSTTALGSPDYNISNTGVATVARLKVVLPVAPLIGFNFAQLMQQSTPPAGTPNCLYTSGNIYNGLIWY